jgi:hypothetical protein
MHMGKGSIPLSAGSNTVGHHGSVLAQGYPVCPIGEWSTFVTRTGEGTA